ncbi:hypothetical protein ACFQ9X_15660 [Catenulispora yoronensis]
MHGVASKAPDPSHTPRKRRRQAQVWNKGAVVPMCADCRRRSQTDQPLDIVPVAISVRVRRRTRELVEVPYFAVPQDRSLWSATGYGSLPGSSDVELVRRVLRGEYRQTPATGADLMLGARKRGLFGRRG